MDLLRPAQVAEVPELNRLIAASARGLSGAWYTARQIDALITQVFGVDTQLLADQTYYVIERARQLVACGGWSHRRTLFGGDQAKTPRDPDLDPRSDAARIRAFFVHPAAARQGLGRRLLEYCEAQALAAGFARTELMATLPGVPLYQAAGYLPLERVTHELKDCGPVEFVRMGRSLVRAARPESGEPCGLT
jgi:GNAT superfamily N-acetyltransferase